MQEIKENKQPENEKQTEKEKKVETDAEKFKRRTEQILLLKKKMELELQEMKKKKEEEDSREKQVCFFFLNTKYVCKVCITQFFAYLKWRRIFLILLSLKSLSQHLESKII